MYLIYYYQNSFTCTFHANTHSMVAILNTDDIYQRQTYWWQRSNNSK